MAGGADEDEDHVVCRRAKGQKKVVERKDQEAFRMSPNGVV